MLDLATALLTAQAKSPSAGSVLPTAVALARGAAEGAVHAALAAVAQIEDNVERAASKVRAETFLQQARRAEAEFTRVMAIGGG